MDETQVVIEIPQAAYDAGEAALAEYPYVEIDHLHAATNVIRAAFPLALAAAFTELADQLGELAEHIRHDDEGGDTSPTAWAIREVRASGLVEGITVIRQRAAQLKDVSDGR